MTTDSMTMESDATLFLGEAWFDPIEAGIRKQIRGFIEGLIEEELTVALGRRRYERGPGETLQRDPPRVLCVKFSKMVLVADVVAPVGNAAALSTGGVHAALRSASFFGSRR